VFHCLNRGNNRAKVFAKDGDYAAFGAGQVFTKTAYNGVHWVTATYTGYNTTGTNYTQAQTPANDIIIEQTQSTYDEGGRAASNATSQRLNDAGGEGAGGAGSTFTQTAPPPPTSSAPWRC
jgi:hypothetical protein